MLDKWNKEIKRQGSLSKRKGVGLSDEIQRVASQEVDLVTRGGLSKKERESIAKEIESLYSSFPSEMGSVLHSEYEREVKRGIRRYISSRKR